MQIKPRSKIQNLKSSKCHSLAIWLLAVVCNLCILYCNLPYALAQDKIVAIVNKEVITQKDLNDFMNILRLDLSSELEGPELEARIESMKPELLGRLIDDRLILQEAKRQDIQVNENALKARMAELKKHYPSEDDFNDELSRQGLVQADLEAKIRDQYLMRAIVERKVRSKVSVGPNEIADFYESNKEKFVTPIQRQLEISGFKDQSMVSELYNAIEKGTPWEELVKKYLLSTDQITVAKDGQLMKEVEEVIFKLKIDEVALPVKVGDIYYVFKLENIIPSRQQPLAEAQETIRNILGNQKIQKELLGWLDEIKKKAYIKIL